MPNSLIGQVVFSASAIVPGQSVRAEVLDPAGESYSDAGDTVVHINGIRGAVQFLQFDRAGDKTVFVTASKDGLIENQSASLQVAAPDTPAASASGESLRIMALSLRPDIKMPLLQVARSPRQPYAVTVSLGRTLLRGGFSSGPGAGASDLLPFMRQRMSAVGESHPIVANAVLASEVSEGLHGSLRLHERHIAERSERSVSRFARSPFVNDLLPQERLERTAPSWVATPVPGGVAAEPMPEAGDRGLTYQWDFGDGTTLTSRLPVVEHDFESALGPDQEFRTFHIKVRVEEPDQPPVEVARTLSVHNAYATCKKFGMLVPKAHSATFASRVLSAYEALVTIDNIEAQPITLTSRTVHPMLDGDDLTVPGPEEALHTPITVPSQGSVVVPVTVALSSLPKGAVGFAVTFCGTSAEGLPIRVETHFDLSAKDRASNAPRIRDFSVAHFAKVRDAVAAVLAAPALETHPQVNNGANNGGNGNARARLRPVSATLQAALRGRAAGTALLRPSLAAPDAVPMATRAISSQSVLPPAMRAALPTNASFLSQLIALPQNGDGAAVRSGSAFQAVATHLRERGFLEQSLFSFQSAPAPVENAECDPDNSPDEVIDDPDSDWACQATPEKREVITKGRFLNARKGDVLLSPGGPGLIGTMLRQVSPPQRYSHSGIMTRNYDQVTHSTASEDRMLDYPVGSILGEPAPSDGHRPDVVKYGWPGVITQSVEESMHGSEMTDPESGKKYKISGFSREDSGMSIGGNWEIVHPLVIKPDPLQEAKNPEVRKTLHQVASDALAQTGKGHYRFYCYTDPTIADDPAQVGAADAGWAAGTQPSVCSSFIWHTLRKRGLHLEGDGALVTSGDLEDIDRAAGGQVGSNTSDGLYLYSAEERLAAAHYLHDSLTEKVKKSLEDKAGVLSDVVDTFSDISDDVANQIVNTFASDWAATDAKDSDAWKNTVAASAVSPDNMLLWDAPNLKGLYGYAAPLIYREPRLETVTIYRWHKVQVKGTVSGTVRFNGQPSPGAIVQLYDGKTTIANENGDYSLEHVPLGSYEVKASSDLGGIYLSATVPFTLSGSAQRVDVDLQAPSALFRRLKIQGTMHIVDFEDFSSDEVADRPFYREMYLGPFGTHGETSIVERMGGEVRVELRIVADWNLDKSIHVWYENKFFEGASEDTDDLDGSTSKAFDIPENASAGWNSKIHSGGAGEDAIDMTFVNEVNPH